MIVTMMAMMVMLGVIDVETDWRKAAAWSSFLSCFNNLISYLKWSPNLNSNSFIGGIFIFSSYFQFFVQLAGKNLTSNKQILKTHNRENRNVKCEVKT